jgi:flagellar hook-length control protein FliK
MSTPIKSSNTATPSMSSTPSTTLNDLMSKLSGQGADGLSPSQSFSHWMDKHALVSGADAQPKAASPSSPNGNANSAAQASNASQTAAKLAEQTQNRTRQQALATSRATEQATAAARQDAMRASEKAQQRNRNDGAHKADDEVKTDTSDEEKSAKADKTDKEDGEVAFQTSMGEGSAVVRELTPPAGLDTSDSAGMMAWLASLTHGDLHGKAQAALTDDSKGGAALSPTGDGKAQDLDLLGKGATHGVLQLDNPLWQSASNNAALQVDAMLGQVGKGEGGRGEGDPLSGLMGAGAFRTSAGALGGTDGAAATTQTSATLDVPFGSTDFAQALAEKVAMWVGKASTDGPMTAELHLNPAEMGPINVKISLDGQSAQVDFAAAALETRKAIEASMPMLSSALNDIGLNLAGSDVSSQTSQQQAFSQAFSQSDGSQGRGPGGPGGQGERDTATDGLAMRQVAAPRPGGRGGLDLYA